MLVINCTIIIVTLITKLCDASMTGYRCHLDDDDDDGQIKIKSMWYLWSAALRNIQEQRTIISNMRRQIIQTWAVPWTWSCQRYDVTQLGVNSKQLQQRNCNLQMSSVFWEVLQKTCQMQVAFNRFQWKLTTYLCTYLKYSWSKDHAVITKK